MGDQHQGHAARRPSSEEKVGDLAALRLVEIAGWLVGEQDGRLGDQGAGNGDALLLAAGEFGRIVADSIGEAHRRELAERAVEGVASAGKLQRHRDILQGRHVGDEVEGLENDADCAAAEGGEGILAKAAEVGVGDSNPPAIRPFQAGHYHEERRLAGARRTDQAHRLPGRHRQADAPQDVDPRRASAKRQVDISERDDGFGQTGNTLYRPGQRSGRPRNGEESVIAQKHGGFKMAAPSWGLGLGLLVGLALTSAAAAAPTAPQPGEAASLAPLRLVVVGDSLSSGYGLKAADAFPAALQKALADDRRPVTVVNAGVSGDTANDGLARLDWSVGSDANAVILELGANDALRGIDPAITRAALDAILTRLKTRHLPVLLAGMLAPPNMGDSYAAAFDGIFPDLAKSRGVPLYPFFLDGVATDPKLEQDDGMHPNAAGVAVIVQRILPAVEALIAQAPAAR